MRRVSPLLLLFLSLSPLFPLPFSFFSPPFFSYVSCTENETRARFSHFVCRERCGSWSRKAHPEQCALSRYACIAGLLCPRLHGKSRASINLCAHSRRHLVFSFKYTYMCVQVRWLREFLAGGREGRGRQRGKRRGKKKEREEDRERRKRKRGGLRGRGRKKGLEWDGNRSRGDNGEKEKRREREEGGRDGGRGREKGKIRQRTMIIYKGNNWFTVRGMVKVSVGHTACITDNL